MLEGYLGEKNSSLCTVNPIRVSVAIIALKDTCNQPVLSIGWLLDQK